MDGEAAREFRQWHAASGRLFVHVPRTGGSEVRRVLATVAPGVPEEAVHFSAAQYRHAVGAARYDAVPSFALVRSPWARAASAWHYLQSTAANGAARGRPQSSEL